MHYEKGFEGEERNEEQEIATHGTDPMQITVGPSLSLVGDGPSAPVMQWSNLKTQFRRC